MKQASEAEKAAKLAYQQHYARMIGVGSLMSHAEISLNFFLAGVKWAIEQAEKMAEPEREWYGEKVSAHVWLSDLQQLLQRGEGE